MNRALGVAIVAFGCGGAPKPAPIAPAATAEPAPPPPAEKPAPLVAKGGDPCDGGEIASRGGERKSDGDAGAHPSSGDLAGASAGAGAPAPGGPSDSTSGGLGGAPRGGGNQGPVGALHFGDYNFGPGLDTDGTKRVFTRNHNRLLYCFNAALQRDPNLSGTVTLDIAIEKSGLVSSAHAEGVDDALDRCIQHGVTSFQLPAAKQRSHLTARLQFTRS